MPTPKQQRRRALELLEASIDGCTEAIMLAYGFKTELLVELVNAGFATASIERMVAGERRIEVTRHQPYVDCAILSTSVAEASEVTAGRRPAKMRKKQE
jgi:hypothetical protein